MRKNKKNSLAFRRKIPVAGCFDVVVCGGGPAGFSAAAAAARAGMNTLLIERFNCLGGAGTVGLVGPFAPTDGTNGGVYREILQRLAAEKSLKSSWYYRIPNCFDAETYKYAAQTLCEEAGVRFLFDTMVSDVIMRRREIEGVVVANKGGLQAVFGQVTIDATGDGDIAWMAGAPYEKGDRKGRCQPTTFFFNIGGIRPVKLTARDVLNIKRAYRRALREGAIHLPRHMDNIWSWTDFIGEGSTIRAAETSINIDMTSGMDGTDPEALSKAEAEGRRQAWECLRFFRKNIPGAEKAYITQTNLLYGLRETRRIRGEYYLTKADI
ncbi:MAG: FAD-dependent oxidoreductase, partial [Kiritimatiellae bacterium]|nr:FAD-dependent oxidoreductase [Kiritimatiellia bacterium]